MRLRHGRTWQWTVGASLALAGAMASAQSSAVPDAPQPQTLPKLNTITPTAPAIKEPAPLPSAAPASTVPTALPSSPTPTQSAADKAREEQEIEEAQRTGGASAGIAQHASDITVQVDFVQIPFTVKDSRGQLVPGLTARDVQVYESGLRQSPRLFTVDPLPLSVAVVIDQSVTFDTMRKINASLSALQASFAPYDEVAIFTYNNGVRQVTGFTGAQSARVTYALERSKGAGREPNMAMGGPLACTTCKNNLPVDPNTNGNNSAGVILQTPEREFHTLNDAVLTAAETLAKAGKGRRRVMFVISDGKEYGSQAKQKEVIRYLQRNEITVFATLVGDSAIPGTEFLNRIHLPLQMRDDILPKYTAATGGDFDAAFRPRGIENSFAKLSEQVRTQYTIGYYSHEPFVDGKFRPIEVKVMRPALTIIAKPGYYPNAGSSAPGRPVAAAVAPSEGAAGTNAAPAPAPQP